MDDVFYSTKMSFLSVIFQFDFFKINLCNPNINPVNIKLLFCAINFAAGQKQKYKYKS